MSKRTGGAAILVVLLAVGIFFGRLLGGVTISNHAGAESTPNGVSSLWSEKVWPSFGYTQESTRAAGAWVTPSRLTPQWQTSIGSLIEFPPVIGFGEIVVNADHAGTYAILPNGSIRWHQNFHLLTASSPALAIVNGQPLVIVVTIGNFGQLLAVDPATGAIAWRIGLGGSSETSPLVIGDSAYVGTWSHRVLRINLATHRVVWSVAVPGEVKGALVRSGANVIAADYSGAITALRTVNGARVWQSNPVEGGFYAAPSVTDDHVVVGNINGQVVSVSTHDGRTQWVTPLGTRYIYSSTAVAHGTAYLGSYDGRLYALDVTDGRVRWYRQFSSSVSGSPAVFGGIVWGATLGSTIHPGNVFGIDVVSHELRFGPGGGFGATMPQGLGPGRYVAPIPAPGMIVVVGVNGLSGYVTSTTRSIPDDIARS
jgi:outer membrane protein assembly factor BamB